MYFGAFILNDEISEYQGHVKKNSHENTVINSQLLPNLIRGNKNGCGTLLVLSGLCITVMRPYFHNIFDSV